MGLSPIRISAPQEQYLWTSLVKSLRTPRHQALIEGLRALRAEAGLTQQELADRLGKPQSYVAKTEVAERRIDVVEFVAWLEALGKGAQAPGLVEVIRAAPR